MLCPAAVNAAAAAAVWLLAVLGPGLSLPAEDNCSHCFYRQTPPQGASAGLRSLCHRLPGGQAFATLSKPTCDTAAYSAFHLSHAGTEEGGEPVTEEEEDSIEVAVPALLRGVGDPSHPVSPTDSPLQLWDSAVTTLVQSSITPQCSTLGGELYVLTGVGGLGAAEDGDEECQTEPLWSAVCCAVPEGKSGFSMGLIRETAEGERQVSIKELEEMLGVAELFSEGCGGADTETVGIRVGLEDVVSGLAGGEEVGSGLVGGEEVESGLAGGGEEVESGATSQEALVAAEQVTSAAAQPEEADVADVSQETSAGAATSEGSGEEQSDATHKRAVRSESPESAAEYEKEQEADTNSSSILVSILSTTMSIIKAPLQPVFSTVTQLPGQVTYVLQEDLGVLSTLPGETYSLLHLMTSDLLSWTGSAGEKLWGVGENCFSSVYYCSSSMLGALLNSCHTGVTGMGTLAGDTVGIFSDAFDNAWWVTKFFGGRLWDHSEGYVGTVMSEMGGQVKAVGGGLGRLVWRSGNGVGNVFKMGGGLIMGTVDMFIGAVRGAFGQEE